MSETTSLPGAPRLADGIRSKLSDALYDDVYSKSLSREDFDARVAKMSDMQIADAAYKTFYDGKVARPQFNKQVGLQGETGAADAMMRGATMGFADEAAAGVMTVARTLGTLLSGNMPTWDKISGAYNQELQAERDKRAVYNQNHPIAGPALEVAGGVVTGAGAPIPRGAPAQNILMTQMPTRMRTIEKAALTGGLAGFGEGEGTAADRVESMGTSAALGAGMGAALPYAVKGAGLVLGKVGRALGIGDSEKVANQILLKAFQDDGIPPAEISARLQVWQHAGAKPETLFDLGGENVRRLARTAAGRTGPGTEKAVTFLEGRQADQATRVAADVEAKLGQSASDFYPQMQALDTTRRTAAAPLYEGPRGAFTRIVPTADEYAKVERFVTSRNGQDALQRGLRIIEEEQVKTGIPFNPKQYGVVKNDQGLWTLETDAVPNLRLLDAVKRGYDNIIEGYRNPVTGRVVLDEYGRAVEGNRSAFVKDLRGMYQRYGAALDAWSGPSQLMDAANRGRNLFNMRDSDIASMAVSIRNSPAEAEAFRLGVAQAIRDKIANAPDGADAVKRIFGSPQKRELLEAAFPTKQAFAEFEALMKREASMYKNAQFVSPRTGSQTQLRASDAETLGSMATDAAGALALGAVLPGRTTRGALGQIATDLAARGRGISPGVAGSLASRLFTSDPGALARTGGLLSQIEIDNALAQASGRRLGGLLMPALSGGVNVAR